MIRKSFNNDWYFNKGAAGKFDTSDTKDKACCVTLPHDAMVLESRDKNCLNANTTGFYPGGTYSYKKSFHIAEEDKNKDIYFEFEGIYMNAMVYINGDLAGKRPFGYSNFYVKANDFLRYNQENKIEVIAKTGDMPNSRWYSGSGIYRNVKMIKGNYLHIALDGVRITTKEVDEDMAVMEVVTSLENTHSSIRNARIITKFLDTEGKEISSDSIPITIFSNDTITVYQHMTIDNVQLWSTETPYLYTCLTQIIEDDIVIDETAETFGVRTLSLDVKNGLRINGAPVKLRGACIHHDNGVIGACTLERAEERRVEILKKAGFNAIRSSHQPMSKAMLDACDRIGILVMDEAFDVWTKCKSDYDYGLYFDAWWEKDLEAMVAKDYNHPCVIIYSIGNEIPEIASSKGIDLNRKMAMKIRKLDSSRYVTNCINGFLAAFPYMDKVMEELAEHKENVNKLEDNEKSPATEINQFMMNIFSMHGQISSSQTMGNLMEEAFSGVDIAGYNYMVSRYESDREQYPNRIIVGSENWPPQIGDIWEKVKNNPHLLGDFTWTGWDYLGEAGIGVFSYDGNQSVLKPYPVYLAYCGDIDITGHRRPMSYYREIVFGLRKAPYIAVQRVNRYGCKVGKTKWCANDTVSTWTWSGYEGKQTVIEVYSNSQEVELLLNGKSLGKKTVGTKHMYTAFFETVYEPGRLEAVSYSDGEETGRMQLETADNEMILSMEADRTHLTADGTDLSFLTISVTDRKGNLNIMNPLPITVNVKGMGVLQGFGSADPYSTENFYDTTRTTYDGKVLAVIRALNQTGEIYVNITAPGCEEKSVVIYTHKNLV